MLRTAQCAEQFADLRHVGFQGGPDGYRALQGVSWRQDSGLTSGLVRREEQLCRCLCAKFEGQRAAAKRSLSLIKLLRETAAHTHN